LERDNKQQPLLSIRCLPIQTIAKSGLENSPGPNHDHPLSAANHACYPV